jgi:hypothetical protein
VFGEIGDSGTHLVAAFFGIIGAVHLDDLIEKKQHQECKSRPYMTNINAHPDI